MKGGTGSGQKGGPEKKGKKTDFTGVYSQVPDQRFAQCSKNPSVFTYYLLLGVVLGLLLFAFIYDAVKKGG